MVPVWLFESSNVKKPWIWRATISYLLINPCVVQGSPIVQRYKNSFHLCTRRKLDGLFDFFVLCRMRSKVSVASLFLSPIEQGKNPGDRLTRVKVQVSRE